MNQKPKIYFFTGVSGVGKTFLIDALAQEINNDRAAFLHFDSITVPNEEQMVKEYGSGPAWQKAMTFSWVGKMLTDYLDKQVIFFEGQVNIDFIKEAFTHHDFTNYRIILLDCETSIRNLRLLNERKQPELINSEMDNWSKFLLKQAVKHHALIIDTGKQTIEELVNWCKNNLVY